MDLAPAAFRDQLLAALPRVRRYARSLCFDPQAADDLVQTVAERALTHWHQYDQQRDLLAWLVSITHNAHMDGLRRTRRLQIVDPFELARDQDAAVAAPAPTDPGLRLDLMEAFERLSTEHRECLLLVGVEGLSYAQCADSLGVPIGTVMSRMARARASLRSLLEGGAARSTSTASASDRPSLRRVR